MCVTLETQEWLGTLRAASRLQFGFGALREKVVPMFRFVFIQNQAKEIYLHLTTRALFSGETQLPGMEQL